mmetsp:Transcript_22206/g.75406  ORF Transcript_22206/g.75406 Transcript_22206/m.75406 type:complete len:252 (+) Transcript_22206:302-1057(+)
MPVGHLLVLHLCDWMHPSAKSMARAELHTSAPSASVLTTEKPVSTLPEAMTFTWSRSPAPLSVACTSVSPSDSGVPTELLNSGGAAPVPPSAPSTVMKSGVIPVLVIALTISTNSTGLPTQSLNPTGLPPESSRIFCRKCSIPSGESNALCLAGLLQSPSGGHASPLASAISSVIFALGSMPPCAGFAPWLSLSSIMRHCGLDALSLNIASSNTRLVVPLPHPKYPVPTFHTRSPPPFRWNLDMPPSPVLW